MKHQILSRLMSGKNINEYFGGKIEKVVIEYTTTYRSFAGVQQSTNKLTKMPDSEADFYVYCDNQECTVGYVDLRQEVDRMVREGEAARHGEKRCEGKAAPDHPNQRCDTTVSYEIRITYSE